MTRLSDRALAMVLGGWALLVRLVYVWDSSSEPLLLSPTAGLDAQVTWEAARLLTNGEGVAPLFELKALSAPLYPWWVTLHRWVLGDSLLVQRVVTAAYTSIRFALLYLVLVRIVGKRWPAVLATVLLSVLPSLVYFDTALMKLSLDLNLLVLLIWFVTRKVATPPPRPWLHGVAVGCLGALMLLSQLGSFLTLGAIFFYFLALKWPRKDRLQVVLVGGTVFAVAFSAWVLRPRIFDEAGLNYLPRSGVDLRIGLNEKATGHYMRLKNVTPHLWGHAYQYRMAAELDSGVRMSFAEANAHYTSKVKQYGLSHPGHLLRLSWLKLENYVSDFEFKGSDYLYDLREESRWLGLSPVSFGWLFIGGVLGVFSLVRRRMFAPLVLLGGLWGAVLATNLLTFAMWRFRLPAVIPLTMLTAFGALELGEIARGIWERRRTIAPRVVWVLVLGLGAGFATFRAPT